MKKFLWILLAFILCLAACKKDDPAVTTDAPMTTEAPVTVQTTAEPPMTSEAPFAVENVAPDLGKDVEVNYEVLLTEDEELNALLEKAAAAEMVRYIPNASSVTENGGSAEYSVEMASCYAEENLISAVFTGTYSLYYEDGAGDVYNGEVFYTVLIDPTAKKLLSTADIVSDFAVLKADFADGRFTAVGPEPHAHDIAQYRTEYGIYPYVSLDAENFYLYITDSGMSEYTTSYFIPRTDAADFMKF